MKKLLTSAAFLALLAAPAFAEDATPMDKQAPAATQPETPAMQGETPAAPGAAEPAQPGDSAQTPAATPEKAAPPAAVAGDLKFMPEQAADEQLASSWIGKSVYNTADENLGDVNDIVIGASGQVDGVVLGVGGFLGIGEKSVAVPFTDIKASTDADGRVKLTLNATKEQLDAAPDFVTLADKAAKARSEAPATESPAGPATPAPAQ
jgi:sporulation protein YlmC with PRC-barrel domain